VLAPGVNVCSLTLLRLAALASVVFSASRRIETICSSLKTALSHELHRFAMGAIFPGIRGQENRGR
jgi:hypothetical protein